MESDASPKTLKPAHVVIVGAGPSGLLLAFYLLEFGGGRFRVSIFESREDLRVTAKRELNARRYSLVLSFRGQRVLAGIPGLLEAIGKITRPNDEVFMHLGKRVAGRAIKMSVAPGMIVDRADLCAKMLEELLQRHEKSGLLALHFFKQCTGVDFENHEALFEDVTVNVEAQGSPVNVIPGQDTRRSTAGATWQRVPYDLLVGADGVNSAVRHSFELQPRGFDCSVMNQFLASYILHIPRPAHISPTGFNLVPSIPNAQSLRCLFYPNGHNNEETLNLALIWPYDDPPTEFLAMKDPAEMTEWLQKRLPWLQLTEAAAKDILEQRVTTLRMVKCEPYHSTAARAVLIGDAAHATPPAIGQGCNASLVDAAVLARLLLGEKVEEDDRLGQNSRDSTAGSKVRSTVEGREEFLGLLPGALERYSALQVQEGHALVDLSDSESPLDRHVAFWHQIRTLITGTLAGLLPWFFSPPVLLAAGTGASFSDMRRLHAKQVEQVLASNARVRAQWRDAQAKKVLAGE